METATGYWQHFHIGNTHHTSTSSGMCWHEQPASHVTISPVMLEESDDARNATTFAMSEPFASRRSGQFSRRRAAFAGSRTSQRSV